MKRTIHAFAVAAMALLVASPAFAQWSRSEPAHHSSASEGDSGFTLGLRGAWGVPLGTLGASANLADVTSGNIPVWVEAGYRFNRNVSAGLFAQFSRGFSANCPNQADCSTGDMRFGAQAAYSFMPSSTISPWAGLGVGYEFLSWSRAGADSSAKGIEYGNLQLGADWNVNPHSSFGPFAAMTFGKFSSQSSGGVSSSYTDTGMHSWMQFGLRFLYKL